MTIARRWMGALAVLGAGTWLTGCITPPSGSPTTTTEPVSTQQCETERETIELALEAGSLELGEYPPSIQWLLDHMYLAPKHVTLDWSYSTDGASFTLTGDC